MEHELNSNLKLAETIYNMAASFLVNYSFQLIGAMIIFVIGIMVARWASRSVENFCIKHKLEPILARFMANGARIIILVGVGIICLGKFGISVAPFVAAIGALSLGAGLALQGVVGNYGAGLALMISRSFTVGDTVVVLGMSGIVAEVRLGCTILDTEDGEKIIIPNKKILGEILRNSYSHKVWEGVIGISFSSSPEKAIAIIKQVLANDPEVAKSTEPQIGIQGFAASAIEIGIRYWIPTRHYYTTAYRINLAIWKAFSENGIDLPFPQQEVRILK